LRQQIVVPFPVSVSPQIRIFSRFSYNADVTLFPCRSINRVKLIDSVVNLVNRRFSRNTPMLGEISNVRDMFTCSLFG